jgi:hypothetical protein
LPDKQPPPPPPLSWAIYLARSKPAKWLGTVEAADADVAIEAAAEEFEVKDSRKLIAVPAAVARWRGLSPDAQDCGPALLVALSPLTGSPRYYSSPKLPTRLTLRRGDPH